MHGIDTKAKEATQIRKIIVSPTGDLMPLSELEYVGMAVSIGSLAIAVLKLYLNQRKARKEIEISKQGIMLLSQLVESYKAGQESAQQLERERFAFEQWRSTAKALGWIFEQLDSEED